MMVYFGFMTPEEREFFISGLGSEKWLKIFGDSHPADPVIPCPYDDNPFIDSLSQLLWVKMSERLESLVSASAQFPRVPEGYSIEGQELARWKLLARLLTVAVVVLGLSLLLEH